MVHRFGGRVVGIVVLALALSATMAAATPSKYSEDVYATGSNLQMGGSSYGSYSGSMIGLGYRFGGLFAGHKDMGWSIGGEYSKGMVKNEVTSLGTTTTTEADPSSYALYLQADHYYDCCDFECGPELYYENTTLLDKSTGHPDDKLTGVSLFGLGGHFGGSYPVAGKIGLFGEYSEIFGLRSFDETRNGVEDKYSAWQFTSHYRAGLRIQY